MWDIICLKEKRIDEVKIMYISVKEAAENGTYPIDEFVFYVLKGKYRG